MILNKIAFPVIVFFMLFVPSASAAYIPSNNSIVDTQVRHPNFDYSWDGSWVKFPAAGTWVSHLTTNDGDTTYINQTGEGGLGYCYDFSFVDNGYANAKLSITFYIIAKTNDLNRYMYYRLFSDAGTAWQSSVSKPMTSTEYTNYTQSFYWNPLTGNNWTYAELNGLFIMLYTYNGGGITTVTEIGIMLTVTQESGFALPALFMYLIGMLIILGINLVGYFKIPILCLFGIIGTLLLAPYTIIEFGDFWMLGMILILVNVGLPTIGLSRAFRE